MAYSIESPISFQRPKTIVLFTLEFLMGEFGSTNWNLLVYKGTGEFVGLTEMARFYSQICLL